MVLLKQSRSFRLKEGAFSLFLFLLLDYCQAADGNSDSLEVMDLTLYLFLFFFNEYCKSTILLERGEGSWVPKSSRQ